MGLREPCPLFYVTPWPLGLQFIAAAFHRVGPPAALSPCRSTYNGAVRRPVWEGFRRGCLPQARGALEIGQGAADFEDAIEGAGGQAELLEGVVEEALTGSVETAVAAEVLVRHRRVDRDRAGRAEAG